MVNDDYKSVYDANLLNRDGTNANADESRWLIALEFNNQDQVNKWAADWHTNTSTVEDYIKLAQANQTWPEEIQPLQDIPSAWNTYYGLDSQIRSAANSKPGDPQALLNAEAISTGRSNDAFAKFTTAVDQLRAANYLHYNETLNTTQQTLNLYIVLSAIIFPLIGLFAVWGVSQRLKDF